MFGRYSRIANDLIEQADCLVVVGSKLGEIATRRYELLPTGVPVIQMDIDAEEIGRSSQIDVGMWCDAESGLTDLLEELAGEAASMRARNAALMSEVENRRLRWQQDARPRLDASVRPIAMGRLVTELNRDPSAGCGSDRGRRICGSLVGPAVRHQAIGANFHCRSRPRVDRIWASRCDWCNVRGIVRSGRCPHR